MSADAQGDLTPPKDKTESSELPKGLDWFQPRDGSYMPTPIIVDGRLYICNDTGRLTVLDCSTGEEIYKQRLPGQAGTYSASAVSAAGNLYFCNESGEVSVVRAGSSFTLQSENSVGETVMATPAISRDKLIVRGVHHLYCFVHKD